MTAHAPRKKLQNLVIWHTCLTYSAILSYMSVSYTLRLPDDLRRLIAQAAKSGGVSDAQLVIDACWKYLEGSNGSNAGGRRASEEVEPAHSGGAGSYEQAPECAAGKAGGDRPGGEGVGRGDSGAGIDKAALRAICAGEITKSVLDAPMPTSMQAAARELLSQAKLCVACDSHLREVKGKPACGDQSCGMYGVEQKGKR